MTLGSLSDLMVQKMGKLLDLDKKLEPPDNLITLKPWEFRRVDWESKHFIQMSKSLSAKLERHRKEVYKKGERRVGCLPAHLVLRSGMANTIQSLFTYRDNERRMREVYYLAGLIDCLINQVNPLLRTDLIRDMYKNINRLKTDLNISWYGHVDQVLFPIDAQFYNSDEYRVSLSRAKTMKKLYRFIREGTDEMFDILSREYVFYSPGRGA